MFYKKRIEALEEQMNKVFTAQLEQSIIQLGIIKHLNDFQLEDAMDNALKSKDFKEVEVKLSNQGEVSLILDDSYEMSYSDFMDKYS